MDDAKPPSQDEVLLAKTKALDKFFADNIEKYAASWDLNFIASIMDWQIKRKLKLTEKQERKVNQIYLDYSDKEGFYEKDCAYNYEIFL